MESDRTLESALEALGDLSADDLNEMLDLETQMTPETIDTLSHNREELSSQLSDGEASIINNVSKSFHSPGINFISCQTPTSETSVMLLGSTNLSTVEVDSFTETTVDDRMESYGQSTASADFPYMTSNHLKTTFDQEFEQINNSDFELPLLDDNSFVGSDDAVTLTQRNGFLDQTSTELPKNEFKSNTQVIPEPSQKSQFPPENISSSCPVFAAHNSTPNFQSIEQSVSQSSEDNRLDVVDFFPLTEAESAELEETLNLSENIRSDNKELCKNIDIFRTQWETNDFVFDVTAIPSSVQRLYDLMKTHYSDFAFVYALCAQLCQDRVPMGCYVNVKIALVLSIASIGKNPDVPPVPIIVMGNDSYMADFLMTSIADLADRFVGPVEDVKPPSSDGFCNRVWIEADPIQLAKDGVFYVGDWSCLKTLRSEQIFKNIESSTVAVERSTRVYSLQTAIWAHWRAFKYNAKDQQIFNKFVKIFGIPIYMDDDNHETLVDYMLKQASVELFESTVDHLSISSDDMRQFLAAVNTRTVDLTPEATTLLREYFVASRIERPDCLTKQAFVVLKQFAESFAKLSLRHEVLEIDAVGAIFMCEHFIQHIYGAGMDPPPALEAGNFVGKVDAYITTFRDWVKNYIAKYCDKG